MHRSKQHLYSITSSARTSSAGGTSRPIAFAVLRLMANSNFVGCWTGRSIGLAPLRIRSRVAKKLKLQESRVVISSERGLAAHRRLRFFERSVVPIVDRRANGGETHGVGTYPGLHYRDGGPGAAAAERISGC